jgi:uncharacterized protein YutE (UPF0331/DUF86 family)
MDEERRLRYQGKIHWIRGRATLISTWTEGVELREIGEDQKTTLAIFKAFQEITEGCMDLIAMYLRDHQIPSRDDYSNIELITGFSSGQKQLLREMNGLRNRIIHRYNGTDERLALEGIIRSLPEIRSIIREEEKWILND